MTIPGIYMPTPHGVTLDISKLGELIEALKAVEADALKRGALG